MKKNKGYIYVIEMQTDHGWRILGGKFYATKSAAKADIRFERSEDRSNGDVRKYRILQFVCPCIDDAIVR